MRRTLLVMGAMIGLVNAAHADFCSDQFVLYVKYLYPKTSQAIGSAVVTFKLGEKPCFFLTGATENHGKGTPIEKTTVFELASVTKVFTTAILGMHVPLGLDVYASVKPDLPDGYDLTSAEEGVTYQQLATFTGGFWWSDPPHFKKGVSTQQDFVDAVNILDPTNPDTTTQSGANFQGPINGENDLPTYAQYSNGSVGFLGQILMNRDSTNGLQYPFDANGFSRWIIDNLTGPLKMPDTRVHPGGSLATGYLLTPANPKKGTSATYDPQSPFPWVPWGAAGALRSTAEDMLTFLEANICAHHMSDPACASFPSYVLSGMATSHNPNEYQPKGTLGDATITLGACGSRKDQAWAWDYLAPPEANPNNIKPIIYKGGDHPGFAAFIGFSPDKSYGLVILTNTHPLHVDPAGLNMIQHTP